MSEPDRHKISPVDIVVVVVIMALFGWFVMGQTTESHPLLQPQANQSPKLTNTITVPAVATGSRIKTVTNNLRQIASAAQQYFMDKGVTVATYQDLVGTSTDNYIRNVAPVAGEDYSRLIIRQMSTQLSISAASFGTVTYNL